MKVGEFKKNFRRRANVWIPRQAKRTVGGKAVGPNATEAKFRHDILWSVEMIEGVKVTYQPEPIIITKHTLREYTADFLVSGTGRPTYHEVKGSYHLPTHERARLAWEIAAEAHPECDFVWAELTRSGWEIERWENGGEEISVHHPGDSDGHFDVVNADWRRHKPRKRSARNRKA